MFGYIIINQGEMKIKDFEIYHSYYCGLCRSLKAAAGKRGQLTLSYDMTFLVMTLTALYEPQTTRKSCRCEAHPAKKHLERSNIFSDYSADMNLILSYYKCIDDWIDEKKHSRLLYARMLQKKMKELQSPYGKKMKKISKCLKEIREGEKNCDSNPDRMAGLFGQIMGELFVWQEDEWKDTLYRMGFYLGKYIYLLDAYEDVEEDKKRENYNPYLLEKPLYSWQPVYGEPDFDEKCEQMLKMMMSECSRAFEMLPIIKYGDILRNILYSGVWTKFEIVKNERKKKQEENHERSI
ncbi:MAG: DUF5685 family protein [Lachnospiraceae bacterium]|nr:DUF5685 family protein [Lachnospiraceae bacterium]